MRKINKILLISLFAPALAMAQKPGGGGVDNQSQDVVKNFDARLIDAEKVNVPPVLPAIDTATKAQTYSVPNKVLTVDYQPPKMRPQSLPAQKLPPQYNGFAKLGYGFPNSPYGEAAYRFGDPSTYLVGAKIKHHSANADKTLENQRFANTEAELNGTFYAQAGLAVDAKLGYDSKIRQFYGYDHDKIPAGTYTLEGTKQYFNTFGASAKAYNSVRTVADINYSLGLGFSNLQDNYANAENEFSIIGEATKWFADKHPLTVVIGGEFTKLSPKSEKTQDLNNIYVKPSFTYKTDVFSIRAGANLISFKDEFFPRPDIEANFNLAGKALAIFAGWKGEFVKNSFRNLTAYNPFIRPDTLLIKNTDKTEYFGGVRGSVGIINYSVQAGYSTNRNLALFSADSLDKYRRFNVIYDTVGIFNLRGAVTAHPTDKLEVTGTISQNIYSANKEKAAWGLPSLDVNVGAKYNAYQSGEQIALVKASLFVQNGVPYKANNADGFSRLDPLFDINIGGEYWFAKNIGVFLDINNLLNLKRQRWQNHPNFGLNILGGVTARF